MKPSEIKIGHTYANKSGRSIRKVLEISSDIKPKWLGTPGCAPDKGIKFEQVRVGMTANGNIYERRAFFAQAPATTAAPSTHQDRPTSTPAAHTIAAAASISRQPALAEDFGF